MTALAVGGHDSGSEAPLLAFATVRNMGEAVAVQDGAVARIAHGPLAEAPSAVCTGIAWAGLCDPFGGAKVS